MKIPESAVSLLRCPACRGELKIQVKSLECAACRQPYPIVDGVPILIHEANSVFRIGKITRVEKSLSSGALQRMKTLIKKSVPSISRNWVAERNYHKVGRLLRQNTSCPLVLVLGSGIKGEGIDALVARRAD